MFQQFQLRMPLSTGSNLEAPRGPEPPPGVNTWVVYESTLRTHAPGSRMGGKRKEERGKDNRILCLFDPYFEHQGLFLVNAEEE